MCSASVFLITRVYITVIMRAGIHLVTEIEESHRSAGGWNGSG